MAGEIARETGRHLFLVGVSIGIATAVGVPLGVAGIAQTVPSLALFGFLIPVPWIGGIGTRTALVALTVYALLPILRNTVTGITGVDPAIREAGRGMGMTDRELLALVGLPPAEYGPRHPHQLSGGQRQRVGVARALAADPPLLLLDEPFGALDPVTRAELQREFRALQARLGKTAVFVTHDLREAARVGDRIALLCAGRLVTAGTPEALAASTDPEVRAFLDAGAA